MKRTPKLLLVRHGATAWTHEGRYNSNTETEIVPHADEQLKRTADLLSAYDVERIVTSPSVRAKQSASILSKTIRKEVTIDDRFREINFGPFEGRTRAELNAPPFAENFLAWRSISNPLIPDGVESFDAAAARVASAFSSYTEAAGITLVVSHGAILRILICSSVLGIEPHLFHKLKIDSGSYSIISFDGRDYSLSALNVGAMAED